MIFATTFATLMGLGAAAFVGWPLPGQPGFLSLEAAMALVLALAVAVVIVAVVVTKVVMR